MRMTVLLVVVLGLAGCGKKTWEPYYELERRAHEVIEVGGSEPMLTPEVDQLISALRSAPPKSIERDKALALALSLETLQISARKKIAATDENMKPHPVDTPFPPAPVPTVAVAGSVPSMPEAAPVAVDAGPLPPTAGMSESEFLATWSRCFSPGGTVGFDGGSASLQVASNEGDCGVRFGAPNTRVSFIFIDGKLWGRRAEPMIEVQATDAGQIGTQPEDGTPRAPGDDGGGALLLIPGAPLPAGLRPAGSGGLYDSGTY